MLSSIGLSIRLRTRFILMFQILSFARLRHKLTGNACFLFSTRFATHWSSQRIWLVHGRFQWICWRINGYHRWAYLWGKSQMSDSQELVLIIYCFWPQQIYFANLQHFYCVNLRPPGRERPPCLSSTLYRMKLGASLYWMWLYLWSELQNSCIFFSRKISIYL